eukprot:TRINITY_DN2972_c0_g2_i1.p1 TRINITY_DN2972_c0_g2~~TRINITY_DN2972_c0_g2_i1.p1  ORF type:complete len:246 (-),score=38.42 TRINITY_DN2972_c0_g2_i1:653-1390(-)
MTLTTAMATQQRSLDAANAEAQHSSEDKRALADELDKARSELREYRARAHTLLQEKDKRIAELASGNGGGGGGSGGHDDAVNDEIATLTAQRDEAQEEVLTLIETIDEQKRLLREAEERAREDEASHFKHTSELTESLQTIKARLERVQRDSESKDQDITRAQEEKDKLKSDHEEVLKARDDEIKRLQKRVRIASIDPSSSYPVSLPCAYGNVLVVYSCSCHNISPSLSRSPSPSLALSRSTYPC